MPVYKIPVVWNGPSAPLLSTHWFHSNAFPVDPAAALANHIAVATFWFAARAVIANEFSYVVTPQLTAYDEVTGVTIGTQTIPNTAAASGTDAGDNCPYQTQGEMALKTGVFVEGREIQGRIYIPGVTENFNVQGAPDSGYVTTLQTAANTFVTSTSPLQQVWSRTHGRDEPVTGIVVRPQWKVLRSRR